MKKGQNQLKPGSQPDPRVSSKTTTAEKRQSTATVGIGPSFSGDYERPSSFIKPEVSEYEEEEQEYEQNEPINLELEPLTERTSTVRGRSVVRNLWDVCCKEIEQELKEVDSTVVKLGLPSIYFSLRKAYDTTDFTTAPDLTNSKSKDFLDFYVFPTLLPALQALIQFARINRVFQCRFCTFNATDFIVEYLYNNNPRYPERALNPTSVFDIPFCKGWLDTHPRTPPPTWMLMSSDEAATIIQRVIRGYMVRCRKDVQEMRQFWRDYREDLERERAILKIGQRLSEKLPSSNVLSPYYDFPGDMDEEWTSPEESVSDYRASFELTHHSDTCIFCEAFRNYIDGLPEEVLKSYARANSVPAIEEPSDTKSEKLSNIPDSKSQAGGDIQDGTEQSLAPPQKSTKRISATSRAEHARPSSVQTKK